MTVEKTSLKKVHKGDGSTTSFSFSFPIFEGDASDINVLITDADGITSTLASGYKVTLNDTDELTAGGYVTYPYPTTGTKLASGEKITIKRSEDMLQSTNFLNTGNFSAETVEDCIDKLTMIAQELDEKISRIIIADESNEVSYTAPAPVAEKVLGWNSTGTGLINYENPGAGAIAATSAAELAKKWASADEGTVVANSKYSALHYAAKAAASAAVAGNVAYGHLTEVTTSSTAGSWFKLVTVTLRRQGDNVNAAVSLLEGASAISDPAKAILWFNITQSYAMGSAPICKLQIQGIENNWITPSKIMGVVSSNTSSSTVVDIYINISKSGVDVGFVPLHIHFPYSSDVSITWHDSVDAESSTPSGSSTYYCEYVDGIFKSLNYPPGFYSQLVIKATSNTTVAVAAKGLSLGDSSGQSVFVSNVSLTLESSSTGANGLDTGSVAASTWYSVWAIYNPTTATVAGLLSTSATSPTLPDGYTFYYRFGWVRTSDSSTSLWQIKQTGNRAEYVIDGTVLTQHPVIASGSNNCTSTEYSVSSYVPVSTAGSVLLSLVKTASGGTLWIAPSSKYSTTTPLLAYEQYSAPAVTKNSLEMVLEDSNIYYASDNSTNYLVCRGWVDNI